MDGPRSIAGNASCRRKVRATRATILPNRKGRQRQRRRHSECHRKRNRLERGKGASAR